MGVVGLASKPGSSWFDCCNLCLHGPVHLSDSPLLEAWRNVTEDINIATPNICTRRRPIVTINTLADMWRYSLSSRTPWTDSITNSSVFWSTNLVARHVNRKAIKDIGRSVFNKDTWLSENYIYLHLVKSENMPQLFPELVPRIRIFKILEIWWGGGGWNMGFFFKCGLLLPPFSPGLGFSRFWKMIFFCNACQDFFFGWVCSPTLSKTKLRA